jgi:hypothetical protein
MSLRVLVALLLLFIVVGIFAALAVAWSELRSDRLREKGPPPR